jgi:hypothetical protein
LTITTHGQMSRSLIRAARSPISFRPRGRRGLDYPECRRCAHFIRGRGRDPAVAVGWGWSAVFVIATSTSTKGRAHPDPRGGVHLGWTPQPVGVAARGCAARSRRDPAIRGYQPLAVRRCPSMYAASAAGGMRWPTNVNGLDLVFRIDERRPKVRTSRARDADPRPVHSADTGGMAARQTDDRTRPRFFGAAPPLRTASTASTSPRAASSTSLTRSPMNSIGSRRGSAHAFR